MCVVDVDEDVGMQVHEEVHLQVHTDVHVDLEMHIGVDEEARRHCSRSSDIVKHPMSLPSTKKNW